VILACTVLIQLTSVTDGRTDGRTDKETDGQTPRRWQRRAKHFAFARKNNKKFELMLTRRAKTYTSFFSQTASLSPAVSSQFILGFCAAADRKN